VRPSRSGSGNIAPARQARWGRRGLWWRISLLLVSAPWN
jgi:hypothetical protein